MTMAPIETAPGQARAVFEKTAGLFEKLKTQVPDSDAWNILSMGMSADYKDAILEGSTCIRVGTAIFGDRNAVNA